MALRYLTAGESHGPALCAIAEGFPAGLSLDLSRVDAELARRQKGYGRGGRMQIETDRAEFLSGIRGGVTLGTPIALVVWNKDHENWKELMSPAARGGPRFTRPRPGHADLAGVQKYGFDDARDALERASARSTAATVALGALARQLLGRFGVQVCSRVTAIGEREVRGAGPPGAEERAAIEASDVRTADPALAEAWRAIVDREKARGGSIGGAFEVWATGLPPGLGTYAHPTGGSTGAWPARSAPSRPSAPWRSAREPGSTSPATASTTPSSTRRSAASTAPPTGPGASRGA